VDDSRFTTEDHWKRIGEAVAAHRRGAAVRIFLQAVGVPSLFIAVMQPTPVWPKLKAIAHTLPYDGSSFTLPMHVTMSLDGFIAGTSEPLLRAPERPLPERMSSSLVPPSPDSA
jgi:hypothetical protein